jgi:hypothetical protein
VKVSAFEALLQRWDGLPAVEAVGRAWRDPGPQGGSWHRRAREELTYSMPLLARALDRLLEELELGPVDWQLWEDPA